MRQIAKPHGATVAQIALAWLLAKPYVTSVIMGASKLSQLEDNLKSVEVQLREAELAKLDEITAPRTQYPNWFTEMTLDPEHKQALWPA
jgi:aryl-alcohol dehydrogenase-like predicted oxidoreductase